MMNRRKSRGIPAPTKAENVKRFGDGVQNFLQKVGSYQPQTSAVTRYAPSFKSFDRTDLEWLYQTSWLAALSVDVVAEDMTREGVVFESPENPGVIEKIESRLDRYRIWDGVTSAIKWSRLYGGAIAVMLIDGADMSQPLDPKTIEPNSFKGLMVLDRWQVQPSNSRVQVLGADFGEPEYYQLDSGNSDYSIPNENIHHSRCLIFRGRELPWNLRQAYQGWGASIFENVYDRIKSYDLSSEYALQLLSKCYLRYYKIEGLREILAMGGAAEKGLLRQMDAIRLYQGIEGMTIGDSKDDFQTSNYSFTGLPDVLLQFGEQVSGAIGVPLVRLFGQSPAGLNSTGESDLRIYYDQIKHLQDSKLRANLSKLFRVMYKSAIGDIAPSSFDFEFKPLWQLSDEQRSQAAGSFSQAIIGMMDAGILSKANAMKEIRKLSGTIGIGATIRDEDIEKAEQEETEMNAPIPPEVAAMAQDQEQTEAAQNGFTVPAAQSGGIPRVPDFRGGMNEHRSPQNSGN